MSIERTGQNTPIYLERALNFVENDKQPIFLAENEKVAHNLADVVAKIKVAEMSYAKGQK